MILIYGASKSEGNYSACLIFYSSSLNSVAVVVVYNLKVVMKESTIPPFANNIMCLTTYYKPQLHHRFDISSSLLLYLYLC